MHYDDYPMCVPPKYTQCKTCAHSHGKSIFENDPSKSYCEVYTRESGIQKPDNVYFDGAKCDFYERDTDGSSIGN